MRLATITDIDEFAALAPAWDRLVREMARPSPFLLHGWLLAWWRHHGRARQLCVHVAYRPGRGRRRAR
jgi:CelD/BcsL family acetyltransferase involved in cellulose biosynthesis